MRFVTDDDQLRCGLLLDTEDPRVDLTAGGLGDDLLDALVQGILEAHVRRRAPEGDPWPALAARTVRRKGHSLIGVHSGRTHLLDPLRYLSGDRQITPREAWWSVSTVDRQIWKITHGWQNGNERNHCPARRLIGWSPAACDFARRAIAREEARWRA
jgi:hypothetical protein